MKRSTVDERLKRANMVISAMCVALMIGAGIAYPSIGLLLLAVLTVGLLLAWWISRGDEEPR